MSLPRNVESHIFRPGNQPKDGSCKWLGASKKAHELELLLVINANLTKRFFGIDSDEKFNRISDSALFNWEVIKAKLVEYNRTHHVRWTLCKKILILIFFFRLGFFQIGNFQIGNFQIGNFQIGIFSDWDFSDWKFFRLGRFAHLLRSFLTRNQILDYGFRRRMRLCKNISDCADWKYYGSCK